MSKEKLFPMPYDFLYEGMIVPDDIYDGGAKLLLIRKGRTLTSSNIDSIKSFNAGFDIINVSSATQTLMLERILSCKISNREDLEKKTGYTENKEEVKKVLGDITESNVLQQKTIYNMAEELSGRLESITTNSILELINALAPMDEYLQRHCVNVSLLNGLMAKWLELSKKNTYLLILVGLVHDCGKAKIPAQVLSAPRRLSAVEFEAVKMHTIHSYNLLSEFPELVRAGARAHHEKFAGGGYPDGFKAESIPLSAQITAVSDIYDAMVSRRSYKENLNPFSIIAKLKELRDTHLEPSIVDIFVQNIPKEMVNRPVLLSGGGIGVIDSIDYTDIEFPFVRLPGGNVIKTTPHRHCSSVYFEGDIISWE